MRQRRALSKALAGLALCTGTALGSFGAASGVTSYHGNDYSYDFSSFKKLRTCDREADNNRTKGGWSATQNGSEDGSASDSDGANNACGETGLPGTEGPYIIKHHTCEKNHLTWNCGNWQLT